MNKTLPGKQTLLALSLVTLVTACGTKDTGDDGTADNDNAGRDTSINSTAGGYETSNPIGGSDVNGNDNDADLGSIGSRDTFNDNNDVGSGDRPTTFMINFDLDSAEMTPDAIALLKEHAAYMRANPSLVVVVEGHADERGSREYNIGLGQRRAEAVRRLMVLEGVRKQRIDTISFGEEKPLDFRHDEGAWAANRRAVFVYPQ